MIAPTVIAPTVRVRVRAHLASNREGARLTARGGRRVLITLALAAWLGCRRSSPPAASADPAARSNEPAARLADAADVLAAVAGEGDDHRIPAAVAARARCVAVVPSLINGAFFVGAKYGHGVLTCRTGGGTGGWSSPAFFTLTGGSAGFEIGYQSVDLVMLVLSEHGRRAFTNEELRLGGDVSATAGPEGRGRSEDTDPALRSEVVSYSRSRGLFAGVDLSGAVVRADPDAARALYGHDEPLATLLESPAPTASPADVFLSRVRAAF